MKFKLTSPFGIMEEVRGMKPHSGIDLGMPEGTPLRSVVDGVVEKVWDHAGSIGSGVKIRSEDGVHTIYGHMSDVKVKVGEHVSSGEFVGLSGNTGNSTGPHLHFGMQDDHGTFVDPSRYIEKVDSLSGGHIDLMQKQGMFSGLFDSVSDKVVESTKEKTIEVTLGIIEGLADVLAELIGAISLVGCTVLIIMKVAGYDKGFHHAGLLFVFNILCKLLLGGPR